MLKGGLGAYSTPVRLANGSLPRTNAAYPTRRACMDCQLCCIFGRIERALRASAPTPQRVHTANSAIPMIAPFHYSNCGVELAPGWHDRDVIGVSQSVSLRVLELDRMLPNGQRLDQHIH